MSNEISTVSKSYTELASDESIAKTSTALTERNIEVIIVTTKEEALAKIKEVIPQGASVMNGASRTLEEIGYIEYLQSATHGWKNLKDVILAEKDSIKQAEVRKQSVLSDFYLGSVHAVAETGEIVIASNTGSQLPHIVFTSPNIIFVVSTQKITPTISDALKRVEEYVLPLEDKRMHDLYGVGTMLSKELIFRGENPKLGRKFHLIFVKEKLGF